MCILFQYLGATEQHPSNQDSTNSNENDQFVPNDNRAS